VYSGPRQDISSTIIAALLSVGLVNLSVMLASTAYGSDFWGLFLRSNEFVAMMLMFTWLLAYSLISVVIFFQFEWNEHNPADDYYFEGPKGDSFSTGFVGAGCGCEYSGEKSCNCELPIVLRMPNDSLALGISTLLSTVGDAECLRVSDSFSDTDEYIV